MTEDREYEGDIEYENYLEALSREKEYILAIERRNFENYEKNQYKKELKLQKEYEYELDSQYDENENVMNQYCWSRRSNWPLASRRSNWPLASRRNNWPLTNQNDNAKFKNICPCCVDYEIVIVRGKIINRLRPINRTCKIHCECRLNEWKGFLFLNLLHRTINNYWHKIYLLWFKELTFIFDFVMNNVLIIQSLNARQLETLIRKHKSFIEEELSSFFTMDLVLVRHIQKYYYHYIDDANVIQNVFTIALHKKLYRWQRTHSEYHIKMFQEWLTNEIKYVDYADPLGYPRLGTYKCTCNIGYQCRIHQY
jgi:hypothetical protein